MTDVGDWRERGLVGVPGAQQVIDRLELAGGYIDHLDVSHNRLNSDGCIHLFQGLGAIRHRQTIDPTSFKLEIRRISVAGNWIGDPVFPAIADYIQGNAALTHLHLQNNGIQGLDHMTSFGRAIANSQVEELSLYNNPLVEMALSEFLKGLSPKDAVQTSAENLHELHWSYVLSNEMVIFTLADFLADRQRSRFLHNIHLGDYDGTAWLSFKAAATLLVAIYRYNRNLFQAFLPSPRSDCTTDEADDMQASVEDACIRYARMELPVPRGLPSDRDLIQETLTRLRAYRNDPYPDLDFHPTIRERTRMNVSAHASLFSSATLLIPATRILLNGYKDDRFEGRSHILDLPPEILSMIIRNIASRPELPSEKQWHDLVSYATDRRTLRSESEFLHSCEWYLPEDPGVAYHAQKEKVMSIIGWNAYDA